MAGGREDKAKIKKRRTKTQQTTPFITHHNAKERKNLYSKKKEEEQTSLGTQFINSIPLLYSVVMLFNLFVARLNKINDKTPPLKRRSFLFSPCSFYYFIIFSIIIIFIIIIIIITIIIII